MQTYFKHETWHQGRIAAAAGKASCHGESAPLPGEITVLNDESISDEFKARNKNSVPVYFLHLKYMSFSDTYKLLLLLHILIHKSNKTSSHLC
jgi:hypothetical protein